MDMLLDFPTTVGLNIGLSMSLTDLELTYYRAISEGTNPRVVTFIDFV